MLMMEERFFSCAYGRVHVAATAVSYPVRLLVRKVERHSHRGALAAMTSRLKNAEGNEP